MIRSTSAVVQSVGGGSDPPRPARPSRPRSGEVVASPTGAAAGGVPGVEARFAWTSACCVTGRSLRGWWCRRSVGARRDRAAEGQPGPGRRRPWAVGVDVPGPAVRGCGPVRQVELVSRWRSAFLRAVLESCLSSHELLELVLVLAVPLLLESAGVGALPVLKWSADERIDVRGRRARSRSLRAQVVDDSCW